MIFWKSYFPSWVVNLSRISQGGSLKPKVRKHWGRRSEDIDGDDDDNNQNRWDGREEQRAMWER